MELLLIYLWLKLDAVQTALVLTTIVGGFALGIYGCAFWSDGERAPHFKKYAACWVAALVTAIALPTSKEMAILVGSHYALRLADSAEGQKVMSLIRKKANDYLDEQLKPVEKK